MSKLFLFTIMIIRELKFSVVSKLITNTGTLQIKKLNQEIKSTSLKIKKFTLLKLN